MFAFHSHTHKSTVRLSEDNRISSFHSCFALVLRRLVALCVCVCIAMAVGCSAQSTTYNYISVTCISLVSLFMQIHVNVVRSANCGCKAFKCANHHCHTVHFNDKYVYVMAIHIALESFNFLLLSSFLHFLLSLKFM